METGSAATLFTDVWVGIPKDLTYPFAFVFNTLIPKKVNSSSVCVELYCISILVSARTSSTLVSYELSLLIFSNSTVSPYIGTYLRVWALSNVSFCNATSFSVPISKLDTFWLATIDKITGCSVSSIAI